MARTTIYSGKDPKEIPLYRVSEAAHYLNLPTATLRAWAFGQDRAYRFRPVLEVPASSLRQLSFVNIVEAHVLDALRRKHEISLQKIRLAIRYLKQAFPSPHPLVDNDFVTDGIHLFVEKYGRLINASSEGQLGLKRMIEAHLQRVERDQLGRAIRLYPFTRRTTVNEDILSSPRHVAIDPRFAFGRPILVASALPTAVIAQRYKAGESVDDLADDYDQSRLEIEEAIRCELAA